jgi:7-cyano-7-deazaguanine synthase
MSLVILASGGIDSTLMSLMAREEGLSIYPLFIDYGQMAAPREWRTIRKAYSMHRLAQPVRMSIAGYGKLIPSGITNPRMRISEDAFLPGRNMLMLLCGASYAYRIGARGVAIGLLNPDAHLFPDQTEDFLKCCETSLSAALGRRISVVAPLLGLTKRDVLVMAAQRGIKTTYSCHTGGAKPCGKCVSCVEIQNSIEGG